MSLDSLFLWSMYMYFAECNLYVIKSSYSCVKNPVTRKGLFRMGIRAHLLVFGLMTLPLAIQVQTTLIVEVLGSFMVLYNSFCGRLFFPFAWMMYFSFQDFHDSP